MDNYESVFSKILANLEILLLRIFRACGAQILTSLNIQICLPTIYNRLISLLGPRWPSGKVSTSGPEGRRLETRFHRRSAVYGARRTPNHTQWPNALPLVRRGSLKRGVPAQVSSSSSDRGSKLRGPSLNSPRVASKRDVNIT
ncbi:hypothetical protein AVEN_128173-1 [Araneus ventricosus]|uniref:Uncharacterized protein n=1 Tax=Araneus ventricosus TaxID=182803 RepID=A0A4Y2A1X2_ARAVE|nr:hypothetical protein AVEN_128173-1 [Araneus ventricosus]